MSWKLFLITICFGALLLGVQYPFRKRQIIWLSFALAIAKFFIGGFAAVAAVAFDSTLIESNLTILKRMTKIVECSTN